MVNRTFTSLLAEQLASVPPLQPVHLGGQTVCVVGANVGLGFEAAKHFGRMGPAKLILACRNLDKGNAALHELEQETFFDRAEVWIVDLAQFSSVKAFADKFKKEETRLDILVMNAGIHVATNIYNETADGWESTLQVNHLATVMASLLLLPLMQKTARKHSVTPRLVVVSSEAHYFAPVEPAYSTSESSFLRVLGSKEYCSPKVMNTRYPTTKLFNVLFVRALQSRLSSSPAIIVNAVTPGFCYSLIRREMSGIVAFVFSLLEKVLARSTEEGSRQLVWAAIHGDAEELKGTYVSSMQIQEPSGFVMSAEGRALEDRLWRETIEILTEVDPEIESIIGNL